MTNNGTLALTGSGEYLPPMEAVDRNLLDRVGGSPRVVCLPTGAGTEGDTMIERWMQKGVDHFSGLGVPAEGVRVIDRASADDESLAGQIRAANFVYLSGGKPDHLYKSLVDTLAFEAILSVLDSGGVIAGCSAGAMIWGKRSSPIPGSKGFNRLGGAEVLPHYDEIAPLIATLIKRIAFPFSTMLGIESNTALISDSSGYSVIGSGGVTVWKISKRRYIQGESPTW